MNVKFGRLEPVDRSYEEKYPISKLFGAARIKKVENTLLLPSALRWTYNQGQTNSCTGFAAAWMMSILNNWPQQIYDGLWAYHQAQLIDGNPATGPGHDVGTYVWAVMDVLKKQGHKKLSEDLPDLNDGILSYYWAKNIDDIRAAIGAFPKGRPLIVGTGWFENFMIPEIANGEYWIGRKTDLGKWLAGHATCLYGASDRRQAFKLTCAWGIDYPPVWIPYKVFDKLMGEGGEAVIAVDNPLMT